MKRLFLILALTTMALGQTKIDLGTQARGETGGSYTAGEGVTILGNVIAVDSAVIPTYTVSDGTLPSTCTAGRDLLVDNVLGVFWYCWQTDTWKQTWKSTVVPQTDQPNTYTAGQKQTFTPSATTAGMNVGSLAGDPSSPANGDNWYNSTTGKLRARQNGATVDLVPFEPRYITTKPSYKKFAIFQYQGSGTALTGHGDSLAIQGTGSASLPAADSDYVALNIASGASVDNRAEYAGNLQWRTNRHLILETAVRFIDTSGLRAFIGITGQNGAEMTTSPVTTGRYFGLKYDPGTSANWYCANDNNAGAAGSDTSVAMDSSWHTYRVVQDDDAAEVYAYIDGALVCTITSNFPGVVPGTNHNTRLGVMVRNTDGAGAKNIRISYLWMEGDLF